MSDPNQTAVAASEGQEPPIHYARQVLTDMNATFPGAWRMADTARSTKKRLVGDQWPDWCFLPVNEAERIMALTSNRDDPYETWELVGVFSAMAAWRLTQGTYRIDQDVANLLMATPLPKDSPTSFLYRLPQWCIFVETYHLGITFMGLPVQGFFTHLDRHEDGLDEARFLIVCENETYQISLIISPERNITNALAEIWRMPDESNISARAQRHDRIEANAFATKALGLLAFLCNHPEEVQGRRREDGKEVIVSPANPTPKRTRNGWRLFAVRRHSRWVVGKRTGDALRNAWIIGAGADKRPSAAAWKKLEPAHWYESWIEPEGEDGERERVLRWQPPLPSNAQSIDDLPAIGKPTM